MKRIVVGLFVCLTLCLNSGSLFAYTVFEDDFSDPTFTSSNWSNIRGGWIINGDGRYEATQTNTSGYSRSFITTIPQLTTYTIEFDLHVYNLNGAGLGSGVTFTSNGASFGTLNRTEVEYVIRADGGQGMYWHLNAGPIYNQAPYTFANGGDYHFKIDVNSGSYSVYVDGSPTVITTASSTVNSAKYLGFYDNNSSKAFDNFIMYVGAPDEPEVIPEPASLVMILFGIFGLAARKRKK